MEIIIILYFCFGFQGMVTGTKSLSVQTFKDYIRISWTQIAHPPEQWTLTYNVMGTNYHSVVKVPGNQINAKIYTSNYPGMFYQIKLFASNNGSETSKGIGFGISDCSNHINTTLGSSYPFESFGYPGGLMFGAICTWDFMGSNDTWFRVHFEDFDIGNNSCNSYLNVGNTKICGNDSFNGTLIIQDRLLSMRLNYRETTSTKGIKFTVSAIRRLESPTNVTARIVDNNIRVEWQQPNYHPLIYSYILRVSHFPFTSHLDLKVDENKTRYEFKVTSHHGQNFSVQLQAVSADLSSRFTDPVFTLTNCDKAVFLKATETFTLQTEQYPHYYLPGLTCHFRFQTEDDFLLRIQTYDLDIGGGKMCDKTYLLVDNVGKFCADSVPGTHLIVNKSSMTMTIATSNDVIGRGVNISVTSVAKPPDEPISVTASEHGDVIHLAWKPPSERQAYIKGYKIQYFIAPSTPGATLSVDKDVDNITVNTQDHPGRLFAIRIAGFNDGGVGKFSHPFYVRAGCGGSFHLSRLETVKITSPTHEGHYEAEVVCHWTVQTDSPLWIKINVEKLMLEDSANCTRDYVNVTGIGPVCGSRDKFDTVVVKDTKIEIIFRTDYQIESEGFIFDVVAVGRAPGAPESVNVIGAGFSIMVNWSPPQLHRRFVTGYVIHFKFYDESVNNHSRVGPDTFYHVLDMTSYPGRLVEIWLQASGDTEDSISTNTTLIRSECGQRLFLSSVKYILSPYYQNNLYNNLQCIWELETMITSNLEVTFIRLNLNNDENRCNNFVRLNNNSYCDDSKEDKGVVLNGTSPAVLEFHTGPSGVGVYFFLKVEPITNNLTESDTSSSVPSFSEAIYSSTPLLMTSYLGTLLASSLLMSSQEVQTQAKTSGNTKSLEKSYTPSTRSSSFTYFPKKVSSTAPVDSIKTDSRPSNCQVSSLNKTLFSTVDSRPNCYNKELILSGISDILPTEASSCFNQISASMTSTASLKMVMTEQTLNQDQQIMPIKESSYISSLIYSDISQSYTSSSTSQSGIVSESLTDFSFEPTGQNHGISSLDSSNSVLFSYSSTTDLNGSKFHPTTTPFILPTPSNVQIKKSIALSVPGVISSARTDITTRYCHSLQIKPTSLEIKPPSFEIMSNELKIKPTANEVKPDLFKIEPSGLEITPSTLEITSTVLRIKPTAAYLEKENETNNGQGIIELLHNTHMLQTSHLVDVPAIITVSLNDVNKVRPSRDAGIKDVFVHNKNKDVKEQERVTSSGYSFREVHNQFLGILVYALFIKMLNV